MNITASIFKYGALNKNIKKENVFSKKFRELKIVVSELLGDLGRRMAQVSQGGHVSRAPGLLGRGEHHGVDTEYLDCEIHLLCHFCRLHDVFDIVIKPIVNFVHVLVTQKIQIVAAEIL